VKRRVANKLLKRYHRGRHQTLPGHLQTKWLKRVELRSFGRLDLKLKIDWYGYDKKTGKPVKLKYSEWHWWANCCGHRFIKRTDIQPKEFVSTICLGIDHSFRLHPSDPVIFETMWFKDDMSGERQERASTLREALKHHEEMVVEAMQVKAEIDKLVETASGDFMIKQYLVAVTYPDHYTPLTDEQIQGIVWDGLPVLPREDITVSDGTLTVATKAEAYLFNISELPVTIEQAWNEISGAMGDTILNPTQKRAFVIAILKGQLANPPKMGGYNG
jgi:hypothetical protein